MACAVLVQRSMNRLAALCLALLVVACGGNRSQVCPSEKHLADPDGHGERCVDDRSSCESVADCAGADACCEAACEDPEGDGVYACAQRCDQPRCLEGDCGPGAHCAPGIDECSAFCIPDETFCDADRIPADPYGTGEIICVPSDSTCLEPDDCGGGDACCPIVCAFDAQGSLACLDSCRLDEGDGDYGMEAPECSTDLDCESSYDEPGWTCISDGCGWSYCQEPPPECVTASDCTLATNVGECCQQCPVAMPWSTINSDPCWQADVPTADEAEPPDGGGDADADADGAPFECAPPVCDAVICGDILCAEPLGVDCQDQRCVSTY